MAGVQPPAPEAHDREYAPTARDWTLSAAAMPRHQPAGTKAHGSSLFLEGDAMDDETDNGQQTTGSIRRSPSMPELPQQPRQRSCIDLDVVIRACSSVSPLGDPQQHQTTMQPIGRPTLPPSPPMKCSPKPLTPEKMKILTMKGGVIRSDVPPLLYEREAAAAALFPCRPIPGQGRAAPWRDVPDHWQVIATHTLARLRPCKSSIQGRRAAANNAAAVGWGQRRSSTCQPALIMLADG